MQDSRVVFDVETTKRKLNSRFRGTPQILKLQWPVISATRPLFYFIRFFGLAPFEIVEDHFIPGGYDVAYSIFCAIAHTYALYAILNKFSVTKRRGTAILDITENAKVIFNYCIAIFNVVMAIWARKEFIEVLNILKHFDSRIRDLGHGRKEGAAKVWVYSICICSAILWTIVNRTGMVAFGESWFDNIIYISNYVATSLSTIKFSSVVLLLGQRFRHLNRVAIRSKESPTISKNYILINYQVIQQLHNSLMNASESLSSQYEWSLLLWLMNLCIHSVSNLYFLVDWLMISAEWSTTRGPLVTCITWWLVIFIAQLLLLHFACHVTASEANSMGQITINWKCLTVSRNYNSSKLQSSCQFLNRKLNFSAAGCFYVNLPLLCSISGLLTTYLVLLVQFQG